MSNAKSDRTAQFVSAVCGISFAFGSASSKQAFFIFITRDHSRFCRDGFLVRFPKTVFASRPWCPYNGEIFNVAFFENLRPPTALLIIFSKGSGCFLGQTSEGNF